MHWCGPVSPFGQGDTALSDNRAMNDLQQPVRTSFKVQMHQAREDAIVDAATRLLGEKGFDGMTVDEVAAAVGIAKASLYKHFSGKHDLCTAAMVQVVERVQDFLATMPPELPALQRLRALLRWSLQLQLDEELPWLPQPGTALARAVAGCPTYQDAMQQVDARLLGWVAEAQACGQLRRELPASVVLCALLARSADPMLEMLRARGMGDAQALDWAVDCCLGGLVAAA